MSRKPAPRGATPLKTMETPLHQRPVVWAATLGALLLVMGLSLSGSRESATPAAEVTSAPELAPELAASIEDPAGPVDEAVEPPPAPPKLPEWRDYKVRNGDNLSVVFARAGFTDTDLYRVAASNGGQSLRKIYPGETIGFQRDQQGGLLAMRHVQSALLTTLYQRTDYGFDATQITREPERHLQQTSLTIESSLFLAGTDAGLSDSMIMELAGIFGGVIDFALDPRVGDTIHVICLGCCPCRLFLDAVIAADDAGLCFSDDAAGVDPVRQFDIARPSGHVVAFVVIDLDSADLCLDRLGST